jgi:hypothetical protein
MPTSNPGTQNIPFSLSMPITIPDGFSNPEVVAAITFLLQLNQQLTQGMLQLTGATQRDPTTWKDLAPQSTILIGNMVRLYDIVGATPLTYGMLVHSGNAGIVPADAPGAAAWATGFILANYAAGAECEVFAGQGLIQNVTGLLKGQALFLGAAGNLTAIRNTTSGQIDQYVGYGVAPGTAQITLGSWLILP